MANTERKTQSQSTVSLRVNGVELVATAETRQQALLELMRMVEERGK